MRVFSYVFDSSICSDYWWNGDCGGGVYELSDLAWFDAAFVIKRQAPDTAADSKLVSTRHYSASSDRVRVVFICLAQGCELAGYLSARRDRSRQVKRREPVVQLIT